MAEKWWYNLKTGLVEQGLLSPSVNRVGPFDSSEEAAGAIELLKKRSAEWAEEDRQED